MERGPFGKNSPVVFTSSVPAITVAEEAVARAASDFDAVHAQLRELNELEAQQYRRVERGEAGVVRWWLHWFAARNYGSRRSVCGGERSGVILYGDPKIIALICDVLHHLDTKLFMLPGSEHLWRQRCRLFT
jgi:hypothetical protein